MKLAQDASSLILSLRKKINIKVRQPLKKALIPVLNPGMKTQLEKVEELIRSEVNIKEIEYLEADNAFIHKKIKPNFVLLGQKTGRENESSQQRSGRIYPAGYQQTGKRGKIQIAA